MSEEIGAGCTRPTAESAPPVSTEAKESTPIATTTHKEVSMIQVGKKAPDFTAPGFHKNAFVNERLSDHLGKWVVLCFYPGDFTFV